MVKFWLILENLLPGPNNIIRSLYFPTVMVLFDSNRCVKINSATVINHTHFEVKIEENESCGNHWNSVTNL